MAGWCPARPASTWARPSFAFVLGLLLLTVSDAHQGAPPPATARHLVLVSIDGLHPSHYDPRRTRGARTPVLDGLLARGSWAEGVIGQFPSLTYPSHTSIATGATPARHGVPQNTRLAADGSEAWYFESSALKVPAIWDAAKEAGLTTAAVSWPVTVGARIDYLFPESNQAPRGTTWLDSARDLSTPGLIDAVVKRLGGFGPNDNRSYENRDRFAAAAAAYIIETWRPNLLLVHLVETDGAQHASGPHSPEALAALERVDGRLGEIVRATENAGIAAHTALLITGDHGFYRVHSAFQPNAVLREAGLLQTDAEGRITAWQAIAHRSAIKLRDRHDAALAARVEKLFDDLAAGPYRGLFRVIRRAQIAALGGDPDALLILEPVEGYTTAAGTDRFLVASSRRGDHGYLPDSPKMHTGLIAAGAGILRGVAIPVARQIDIAPTAARLLGFELRAADGVPMPGLLANVPVPRSAAAGRN